MNKYAAATALAIALITMLALALSASLTPANAVQYCDNVVCVCRSKCHQAIYSALHRVFAQQYLPINVLELCPPPVAQDGCERFRAALSACIASCGHIEGVEHLSQSALRARVKAKEAAQH
jgi:hypothetical protein